MLVALFHLHRLSSTAPSTTAASQGCYQVLWQTFPSPSPTKFTIKGYQLKACLVSLRYTPPTAWDGFWAQPAPTLQLLQTDTRAQLQLSPVHRRGSGIPLARVGRREWHWRSCIVWADQGCQTEWRREGECQGNTAYTRATLWNSPALHSNGAQYWQGQLSSLLSTTGSSLWLGSVEIDRFWPCAAFLVASSPWMPACLSSCVLPYLAQPDQCQRQGVPAPWHLPLCSADLSQLTTMNSRGLQCWLSLLGKLFKWCVTRTGLSDTFAPQALCSSSSWVALTDFTPQVPYNVLCGPWPVLLATWPSFEQVPLLREQSGTQAMPTRPVWALPTLIQQILEKKSTFTKPPMYLCLDF